MIGFLRKALEMSLEDSSPHARESKIKINGIVFNCKGLCLAKEMNCHPIAVDVTGKVFGSYTLTWGWY